MKILKKIVVVGLIFGHMVGAHAQINDQMKRTFNNMTNTTQPGAFAGQERGVITGGNMFIRERITQQNLFSVQMPSFKAGCGGVDFFGGSLSFINAQAFEQILQSIAANARGYAFQLAMDIVCPTCAANMKELQNRMQALSTKMSNSCEMAKSLVNLGGLDEAAEAARAKASPVATTGGWFDSIFSASPMARDASGKVANAFAKLSVTEKKRNGLIGNVAWKSMAESNVAGWYTSTTGSHMQLMQVMMSLSGTGIFRDGFSKDDPTEPKPEPDLRQGIIDLKTIMFGDAEATVFKCADNTDYDGCLVLTTEKIQIIGMYQRVNEVLLGSPTSTGIVAKLRDRGEFSTLTNDEKKFVEAASPGILGILREFAYDTRAARQVADMFALVLAQEMSISFVDEMMDNVIASTDNAVGMEGMRKKVLDVMQATKTKLRNQSTGNLATIQSVSAAFQAAAYVRSTLRSRIDAEREVVTASK